MRTALMFVALLIGCVDAPETNAASLGSCGAAKLQYLVGKSSAVLQVMRFRQNTRILTPGTMMTKDFRMERLNIWINAAGKIEMVRCG